MKRPTNTIINFLSVLSLLLCVGTATLWVRSYRYDDQFGGFGTITTPAGATVEYRSGLFSSSGRIHWSGRGYQGAYDAPPIVPPARLLLNAPPQVPVVVVVGGLHTAPAGALDYWYNARDDEYVLGFGTANGVTALPHAFVAAFFLVLPLWHWAVRRWRPSTGTRVLFFTYAGFFAVAGAASVIPYMCIMPVFFLTLMIGLLCFGVWAWREELGKRRHLEQRGFAVVLPSRDQT